MRRSVDREGGPPDVLPHQRGHGRARGRASSPGSEVESFAVDAGPQRAARARGGQVQRRLSWRCCRTGTVAEERSLARCARAGLLSWHEPWMWCCSMTTPVAMSELPCITVTQKKRHHIIKAWINLSKLPSSQALDMNKFGSDREQCCKRSAHAWRVWINVVTGKRQECFQTMF